MVGFQKINLLDSIHIYVTRIKIEILLEEWEESQIKYYFKKGERGVTNSWDGHELPTIGKFAIE